MNLYELMVRRAEADGGAAAISAPRGGGPGPGPREALTYAELLELAQEVGLQMAREGIGVGNRVALVAPDGPEMAAAFAAMAATVTVAPLNPAYRKPEYDFYLGDLGPKALVVSDVEGSPAVETARELGVRVVALKASERGAGFRLEFDAAEVRPSSIEHRFAGDADVALVLHTSGTTARPKIVPLTHANLRANAQHIAGTLELTPSDRSLAVMPLFHIHGLVGVLLSTLYSGGTVVCTPGFSGERFFGWLRSEEPTWYSAAPAMHQSILTGLESGEELHAPRLRFVRSSSASLPPATIEGLEARLGVPLIEAYGMTEASHQMTTNPLPPGTRKPGSVGPAPPDRARVVDSEGRPSPVNEVGDVETRGANVTLGYESNEAANKESFRDGWFTTGDLGYLDEDGYLFLTGRKREVINRGGEKVSPREVDDVLAEHPSVQQVVTFAVPHATLGEDIAAAVVIRDDHAFDERALRSYALDRLAGFKVPSFLIALDEIPKGPTGKLQRIGLAEKLGDRLHTGYAAPESPAEQEIAGIWEEVLGQDRIGWPDNFFRIGGDSITATMVAARIHERMGVEIPLPLMFQEPTVRGLAEAVVDLQVERTAPDAMEGLLAELDELTDEEAKRMLREEKGGGS